MFENHWQLQLRSMWYGSILKVRFPQFRKWQFSHCISVCPAFVYDFIIIIVILQLCQFCISSMVRQGIQILQIEDKTTIINDTSYQIYYRPQLCISKPYSGEEVKCCFCLSPTLQAYLDLYSLNCVQHNLNRSH